MASNALTNLRGKDPGANRQTDAISRLVEPVAKAVMATPIMGAKPPAWIQPPLLSGFLNQGVGFAGVNYAPARYHKDALGYVHAEGYVTTPGGAAALSPIFTFPPGYRPSLGLGIVANSAGFFVLVLRENGQMITSGILGAGAGLTFSFSFLADQ